MKSNASSRLRSRALRSPLFALVILVASASAARAGDIYYVVTPDQLKLTDGKFPEPNQMPDFSMATVTRSQVMPPYAVLDGPGEVYVRWASDDMRNFYPQGSPSAIRSIAVRVPNAGDVTGRLFVPKSDMSGMEILRFTIPAVVTGHASKEAFFRVKQFYYQRLANLQYPGSAYFRHQAREAEKEVTTRPSDSADNTRQFWRPNDGDDTIAMFSGGRAVSESLQLDRVFSDSGKGEETIDVNSIAGISVTPMDWSKRNQGLNPKLDPLAALIPADQPAIFFPTFSSLIELADESERSGTPLLTAIEPRSQDALTRQRYEQQLGLSLSGLARLLGPQMIKSAAFTASDPYLRTGTDVAILFEAADPAALKALLIAQLQLATSSAQQSAPSDNASFFAFAVTPDRKRSSYMAILGNFIVVTNSAAQFRHIQDVQAGKSPALTSAPEYIFFRNRYKIGEEDETAFLILTDATIRRWCGPEWRIADSRRTRAAAVLSELQAEHLGDLVAGNFTDNQTLHTDLAGPNLGELRLTRAGVVSGGYGSLSFMTPIREMRVTKVSQAEADSYQRWRDSYEQNWRWFFDPIAARLSVHRDKLVADLTIMPLIAGTDYAQFVDIAGAAQIAPDAADPHPDLLHLVLAIDKNSKTVHPAENFLSGMVPGMGADPLSWLGQWVSLYADDDPFWNELAEAKDQSAFFESNLARIPVALHLDVSNGFKLTAFMVAARAFIEQTSPQMVAWESMTYKDQPYVKVSPTPTAIAQNAELKSAAIYYAMTGDSLILTPSERVLQRALDRRSARVDVAKAGAVSATQPSAWLGRSLDAKIDGKMLDLINHGTKEQNEINAQDLAWQNLPILNEYKRLYPDQDPVVLHEQLWGIRLLDPAGGQYVWNDKWQTMESTIYGNPGQPKEGPAGIFLPGGVKAGNFGLTFEDNGLRGVAEIDWAVPRN
jgi:hypothetical protein